MSVTRVSSFLNSPEITPPLISLPHASAQPPSLPCEAPPRCQNSPNSSNPFTAFLSPLSPEVAIRSQSFTWAPASADSCMPAGSRAAANTAAGRVRHCHPETHLAACSHCHEGDGSAEKNAPFSFGEASLDSSDITAPLLTSLHRSHCRCTQLGGGATLSDVSFTIPSNACAVVTGTVSGSCHCHRQLLSGEQPLQPWSTWLSALVPCTALHLLSMLSLALHCQSWQ